MTKREAHNILHIYGLYLEYASGKISLLFSGNIPEFFLPYPKSKLMEAFTLIINDPLSKERVGNLTKECLMDLYMYKENNEALIIASDNFNNNKWREAFIPSLEKFSEEWIEITEEKHNQ